jgi:glycosyltransferase involved in cell wall biosynthesis
VSPEQRRSVLLVAQFSPPSFVVAARRVAGMTKYLSRLGYAVTVLTSEESGDGPVEGAAEVVRTSDLLASSLNWRRRRVRVPAKAATASPPSSLESVVVPDISAVSWAPFALRAARTLVRRERPDCVITTSPPQSAHLVGRLAARRGVPWIAEFRDGWRFERARGDWPLRAQRALDDRLERTVVLRAEALVAVTSPIAVDLEGRFGRSVELITNGFDPDDVDVGRQERHPLLDPERISLVHTGSMGFTGGTTRHLVAALRRLREEAPQVAARLEVVFAGLLSTEEMELLGSPDLVDSVRCVGSLEPASVLQLQRASDVLLVITEGARRRSVATGKLFEYLATSRPILVLGSETEAGRIVVDAGRGVATPGEDPAAIASALRQLVEEGLPPLADRELVERYSWRDLAAAYAAVIDGVCAAR